MGLRIHFVVDPHGWCCMGLIVFVWLYNFFLIPKIVLFPHYEEGHIPGILIIIFYGIAMFCLVALVRASITDPGRLPENPKIPHGEREFWELCNKCNLMRPKRSHHCSRCGHCVRRMDHHCPWINNCVGEDNHWLFLQLCFYTELLTCYALMFSFCHYYYFLPLKKRNLSLGAHDWDVSSSGSAGGLSAGGPSSQCPRVVSPMGFNMHVSLCVSQFPPNKGTRRIGLVPTLSVAFNFICSLKAFSPNMVTF
ncbi:palmitoyltransferase ZDHHC21 isoform X2 [Bos indicus x Bos taurus]|uniref:palmitoyltransferase ZDHHC21 isoform X2 n=1 Tax=Bos indicus x Bos taurus TaxID=30522 RepID=UPI000F7D55A6|nr:palmitoyltransferase ZDHHC21 isoform X2 [Bos indicus x Bos taurus]